MSAFLSPEAMREATGGRWLQAPRANCAPEGVSLDTRAIAPGSAFVALKGERFDAHDFAGQAAANGAVLLVVERMPSGVPAETAVLGVADTKKALSDLARAWRAQLTGTRVVAVTGSAGKTTTRRLIEGVLATELLGSASPKSFNNDIGVPFTILAAKREHRFLVLEIGMNHPGEIIGLAELAKPDVAVITMIGRVHLEGLGSLEAIAKEKSSILVPLAAEGVAIVNGDSAILDAAIAAVAVRGTPARCIRFGREGATLDLRLTERAVTGQGQRIEVNGGDAAGPARGGLSASMQLPGEHNATNALAAIAVGRHFGISEEHIRAGLASVAPAGMRLERVERGGIHFFNDAYNANPDAMAASIRAFAELTPGDGRRVLVLGDMLELGAASSELHREVGGVAAAVDQATPIDLVIAVGRFAADTRGGLIAGGFHGAVETAAAIDEVTLARVRELLKAGDRVLLKGSRGSAMERMLAAFDGCATPTAGH
jgi:UDP-N-acetylmuramoyl-tripeptide--D-alanyl-D-alanine ligase